MQGSHPLAHRDEGRPALRPPAPPFAERPPDQKGLASRALNSWAR